MPRIIAGASPPIAIPITSITTVIAAMVTAAITAIMVVFVTVIAFLAIGSRAAATVLCAELVTSAQTSDANNKCRASNRRNQEILDLGCHRRLNPENEGEFRPHAPTLILVIVLT